MINANLLRGKIVANGYTQGTVAEKINMTANTLSAKLNGRGDFSIAEVVDLCRLLGINSAEEIKAIFFGELSQ